jgi:YVTN family beta-propeller protein
LKISKVKFLTFFAIICSIGLAPINDASAAEYDVIETVNVGQLPQGVAFDSANNRMYVVNYWVNTVSVIDTSDNTVTDTITVGTQPQDIAFDSANNRMYVTNGGAGTVSVIDTSDNTVTDTITVGASTRGIAFDSANNRMYVANGGAGTVSVIDTSDNTVTDTITVGSVPHGIAFDSANNRMYVSNENNDNVSVIDTSDNSVDATTITVGDRPKHIAFDSANNRMYVSNYGSDNVSVIDTSDNTVTDTITVGDTPIDIEFDSANNRMYVTNQADDNVSVIDTSDNTVTDTITVGNMPHGIAFDSANNRMYVSNYADNNVSVIDAGTPEPEPVNTGSKCYDCTPPILQQAQIQIQSDEPITTNGEPLHITANVGDKVTVILNVTDNKSVDTIPFAALYINYQEKPSDMSAFYANNFDNLKQVSTSFYEWNVRADDVAYDYDGTVSWSDNAPTVVTDVLTEENFKFKNDYNVLEYFMMPFTFTMNDSMEESAITAKVYDSSGNRLHVTLPVTLEIIAKENVVLSDNDEIATLDKGDVIITPSEDTVPLLNESMLLTVLSQWSGYSQTTSNDAEVLSVMGLQGESLPAWTKHLGEWVIQEKLDVSELITAIQYVNDN